MSIQQWFYALPLRLRSLFRRNQVDQDLKDELRDHLELEIDQNLSRGMSPEDARSSAVRALGGVAQVEERCRDTRGVNSIQDFFQDLRYGLRQLRRSPGFSLLATLCLTLGIGANATVFSWVEGLLFRPYPLVGHQERLVALTGTTPDSENPETSWPDLLDIQSHCTLIDSVIASKITGATLSIGDHAEVATGSIVSANYFDAIGVRPIMGRGFEPGEDSGRNAHPVAVISYQLWKERFNGDPQIIGKRQRFNNVVFTVVGVAPELFYGTFVGRAMNFWVPASMEEAFEGGGYKLDDRGARWVEGYVRLKAGVTRQQAQQEISAVASRLEAVYPATNRGHGLKLWPLWQTPFNHARTLRPTLEIMLAVAAFLFLIACANVSNLLLVRSLARRQEMTVRLAIGAGRGRLLKQLLTEGQLLSTFGAAGGMLVAYWCGHALGLLLPAGNAMYLPGEMDWRVLALSAGVCLIATLTVGLVPAFQARNVDLASALRADSAGVVGARGAAWVRSSLVVLQVCLSFVLLVGAGLLMESLHKVRTTSPGFSTSSVLDTSLPLVAAGYDAPRAKVFQDQLMDRVRSLPRVESAAYGRVTPLGYVPFSETPIVVDGYIPSPGEQPTVEYNEVSPAYFPTLGIPIVSGREFTRADDENTPSVAIVNKTMAARYWPGRDPVGQRLQAKGKSVQVVGVAADSKYESMDESPRPFFYVPLRQDFVREPELYIRSVQPPETIVAALTREVRALDANLALYETITLQEQVDRSTSPQVVAVTLVGLLGGLALLLASVGLYGLMSYSVSQSGRELGLRMALGADAFNVLRMVISRGLVLTTAGVLVGVATAFGLTRLLGSYLYNVSPRDPLAFGSAFAVMMITAIAACLLPAWRATRTDPARALRD
jgi:predicted permease